MNHNWVIGGSKLNEVVVQYADFKNDIPLSSSDPWLIFPNGVRSAPTPTRRRATEQTKWQFRDDFSWSVTGMGGLGHDFKAGANWIHEPQLFATFNGGSDAAADAELRRAELDGAARCSSMAALPTSTSRSTVCGSTSRTTGASAIA